MTFISKLDIINILHLSQQLLQIIMGNLINLKGKTIKTTYLPQDNRSYFDGCHLSLVDWLRQYSKDKTESYGRGWLGRMLFSGEESLKEVHVLSGGEKVRCMLAKIMLESGNFLMLDEPTNHLDLESITSLNKGMTNFKGGMLFATGDQEIIETVANRIDVYEKQTMPLVDYYEKAGNIAHIDGTIGLENVFNAIVNILGE